MRSESQANESLAETVERLQREIRWIRRLGIAALIVVVVGMVVYHRGRYRSDTAQEFVLADRQGTPRAKLGFFPEGAGLEIYSASGEQRVQLVGGGEEAQLNLYLPVTATRTAAAVNLLQNDAVMATFRAYHASALLDLHPPGDKGDVALSLKRGTAALSLTGAGQGSPKMALDTDATRSCLVLDGAATPTAKGSLCLQSPGLPALELTDLAGKTLQLAPH